MHLSDSQTTLLNQKAGLEPLNVGNFGVGDVADRRSQNVVECFECWMVH